MPKALRERLCKDIARIFSKNVKLDASAVHVLKVGAESMMIQLYREATAIQNHAKRETLFKADVALVVSLHRSWGDVALAAPSTVEATWLHSWESLNFILVVCSMRRTVTNKVPGQPKPMSES